MTTDSATATRGHGHILARDTNMTATTTVPSISFEARAYQSYVLGLKLFWTTKLYRDVVAQAQRLGLEDPEAIEERMRQSTTYQFFGWLERHLQQYKYLGRWGMLPITAAQAEQLSSMLAEAATRHPERLQLDPQLQMPAYYTDTDFHQHPGGVWSDDSDAFMYEWAAGSTTPTHADNADLHVRLARLIRDRFRPASILDLGCGFGKTTLPLKREMPDVEVIGCDLSAPVLRLAHMRALEHGLDITFTQQAAEELRFPDSRFDVVTATMLIHEIPTPALRRSFAEARRVLHPGGSVVYLDFYDVPGGAVGEFFHLGHSDRNNEPFMRSLKKLDLVAELKSAGFDDVQIEPFEEVDGALANGDDPPSAWRFPWTTIVGTVKRDG